MQDDLHWMRRAIRLAMNGRGGVEPNPMVGCVIVKDGRAIGEGYHRQFGGPHAEPDALGSCTESPLGATAYVTLEPCCHTDKKTPPCVPKLIEARVARVVIGCLDPNPQVNGRGAAQLRAAGIEVVAPGLDAPAKQLIAAFTAKRLYARPYVTLKWAESSDGKVAGPGGRPVRISNEASMRVMHQLRSRYVSIVIGINTVISDDPMLTARGVPCDREAMRVVLDRALRTPLTSRIVQTAERVETVIYHRPDAPAAEVGKLAELGLFPIAIGLDAHGRLSLADMVKDIGHWPMLDMLVEPGPTLAASFFASGLVDRVWVFRSRMLIGDVTAPAAVSVPSGFVETGRIDLAGDTLAEYLNPASPVFFAPEPSADFVLAHEAASNP